MRVYYFTAHKYAIESIQLGRLKLALLAEMNDPFEVLALETPTREEKQQLNEFKATVNTMFGMVCFTQSWQNPVHWAHYGECHEGTCLGFEIDEDVVDPIEYVPQRLKRGPEKDYPDAMRLLTTKFSHWSYEDEVRWMHDLGSNSLQREESARGKTLYFVPLVLHTESILLQEVILGARSTQNVEKVRAQVDALHPDVDVFQARTSNRSFKIVTDMSTKQRKQKVK